MDDLAAARAEGAPSRWAQAVEVSPAAEAAAPTTMAPRGRVGRPLPEHELETGPLAEITPPTPPEYGPKLLERVPLRALWPLLNEDVLFKFQWGYLKKGMSSEEHAEQLRVVVRPILLDMIRRVENEDIFRPQAVYGHFRCHRDGDTIVLDDSGVRLRFPRQPGGGRCLSDYVREDGDVLGLMAVTIGQHASEEARRWFELNQYRDYLTLHGLGVEAAEALAELVHRQMRSELGISGDDARDVKDLLKAQYRGKRYAYGYPACPEMADQRHLLELLGAERIGLKMDEDEQLHPEQSTAALVFHHPQARYFKV
jgi:5-methyltetrahydrofolate--homocysteine methyltransferase